MYKVFINGNPLVITNSAQKFEQKKSVKKVVFTGKKSIEPHVQSVLKKEVGALWIYAFELDKCWNHFTSLFKNVLAGGGIVRNATGEVLFIYRKKKWDLPKGKAEKGETIAQTAVREVMEECGITVTLDETEVFKNTYHVYREGSKWVLKKSVWFLMHLNSDSPEPVPQIEEDIERIVWVHPENFESVYSNSFHNIIDLCKAYNEAISASSLS